MGEHQLVNRKRFVSSLANELVEPFNELSKKTRITKTRLLDEAIEDLLKKYHYEIPEKKNTNTKTAERSSAAFAVLHPASA